MEREAQREKPLRSLDDLISQLEKQSQINKDYYKFTVGLATGAIVFSTTFYKQLGQSNHFAFVLCLGWTSLLIGVMTGAHLFPLTDRFKQLVERLKYFRAMSKEETVAIMTGKFPKYMVDRIWEEAKLETKAETDNESTELMKKSLGLKKENVEATVKSAMNLIKEVLQTSFSLLKSVQKDMQPPILLKRFRRTIWMLEFLPVAHQVSFLLGIILIGVFGIISILK